MSRLSQLFAAEFFYFYFVFVPRKIKLKPLHKARLDFQTLVKFMAGVTTLLGCLLEYGLLRVVYIVWEKMTFMYVFC